MVITQRKLQCMVIVILISMMVPKLTGAEQMYKGIDHANNQIKEESYDIREEPIYVQGESIGKIVGELDGKRDAELDFELGTKYEYKKPNKSEIIEKYVIGRYDSLYKTGFYEGYTGAYEDAYTGVFFETQKEAIKKIHEDETKVAPDYEVGYIQGGTEGMGAGVIDSEKRVRKNGSNDYTQTIPADSGVIEKYRLEYDTLDYKTGFLVGYREEYIKSYVDNYRQKSLMYIKRTEETNLHVEGGVISSEDMRLNIDIEPGTVYLGNYIDVKTAKTREEEFSIYTGKIQASYFYTVDINEGEGITLYKPVKLSFNYIGVDNVGVYNAVTGEYLDTYIEEDTVYTYIEPGRWEGGVYVVYIDVDKPISKEYYTSIYKKELVNLYKNGHIMGTMDLDKKVTRGQFFVELGKIMEWEKSPLLDYMYTDITGYDDYGAIQENQKLYIRHAVTQGLLKTETNDKNKRIKVMEEGVEKEIDISKVERLLNLNSYMTNKELEEVMQKLRKGYTLTNLIEVKLKKGVIDKEIFKTGGTVTTETMYKVIYDIKNR